MRKTGRFLPASLYLASITLTLGLLASFFVQPVSATTPPPLYVANTGSNTSNNCQNGSSPCLTIAYAITQASDNTNIYLAAGTYTENLSTNKILLFHGAFTDGTILDGGHVGRVLLDNAANMSIEYLTIRNGNATGWGGGIDQEGGTLTLSHVKLTGNVAQSGGGIYSGGTLTMTDCVVSNNSANTDSSGNGGGLLLDGAAIASLTGITISGNTASHASGAIHNQAASGTLNLTNVTITGNTAPWAGALLNTNSAATHIVNSTIAGNHLSGGGVVGGVENYATITFLNTIISGNDGANCDRSSGTWTSLSRNLDSGSTCAFTVPGDLQNTDPLLGALADNGGPTQTMALLPGSPAINAGRDSDCPSTDQRGVSRYRCDIGAYEVAQLFVAKTGSDSSNNCQTESSPCLTVAYAITQAVNNTDIYIAAGTYTENLSTNKILFFHGAFMDTTILDGGGTGRVLLDTATRMTIADLTIQNGKVTDVGGGINQGTGTLTLSNVRLTGNVAQSGGGIFSDGPLTMTDCVVSGNSANTDASGAGGGIYLWNDASASLTGVTLSGNTATLYGGAIHNQSAAGTVTLTNVTIAANAAKTAGGIDNASTGTTHIVNSTIAGNHLSGGGAVGGVENYANITFRNTIIAGNDGANCLSGLGGTWTSLGHNLDSGSTCLFTQPGDLQNTDPLLGALEDNVGPTWTMALLSGSPAIDAGTNSGCPATDQRGVSRPWGSSCDIGAYELAQLFVAKTGSDTSNNCRTESSPCLTVGHAITQAGTGADIYIASGTYPENLIPDKILYFHGAGMEATILDGGNAGRVITENAASMRIDDLTIRNGYTTGWGGGIWGGKLTLSKVKLTGNVASMGGGLSSGVSLIMKDSVVSNNSANTDTNGTGGGIYLDRDSSASLTGVTISGNTASNIGGGLHNQALIVSLINVTITGNTAFFGGGMDNTGRSVTHIVNSTIAGNHFSGNGNVGGVANYATITFMNSIIAGNDGVNCYQGAGGIWTSMGHNLDSGGTCPFTQPGDLQNTDPVLGVLAFYGGPTQTMALLRGSPAINAGTDSGCPSTDQRGVSRPWGSHCDMGAYEAMQLFVATTGSNVPSCQNSLSPCLTITYAITQAVDGVDIYIAAGTYPENLSTDKVLNFHGAGMDATILDGGHAGRAIYDNAASMTIETMTIQNGYVIDEGGGIKQEAGSLALSNVKMTGNVAEWGGGLYSNGTLTLTDCVLSNNSANIDTSGGGGGILLTGAATASLTGVTINGNTAALYSGGIHNQGSNALSLTNSTITGNTAKYGGAITTTGSAITHIVNSTIAGNHLSVGGAIGGVLNYSTSTFLNTIITGNDGSNCGLGSGTWTSLGHNLDSGSTCLFTQPGDLQNSDPKLGALANNGGPTQTMALMFGSPAINAGADSGCPSTDQRGVTRPWGPHCDIGAYEYNFRLVFLPLVIR